MNHYHSDHITKDKEARIQERIEACYKRACEVQEERYFRLWKMEFGGDFFATTNELETKRAKRDFVRRCQEKGEAPYRRWSQSVLKILRSLLPNGNIALSAIYCAAVYSRSGS